MLIIIGYTVTMVSMIGGFMMAGGNPMLLLHVSEFVVIGGISLGVLIVASPMSVLKDVMKAIMGALKGGGGSREEFLDLMKLLYELFLLGRRNGLIALDEHVGDPEKSSIISKYDKFVKDKEKITFFCNALRPIIDGKIKPDQLEGLLMTEINAKEKEAGGTRFIIGLIADSLPGIGIVAAVLGIINTMSSISEGPEAIGAKVGAALTGTFLGILGAYGFIAPMNVKIHFNEQMHFLYYRVMVKAISSFAKGVAPIMAIEIARRSLPSSMSMDADELEKTLKDLNAASG